MEDKWEELVVNVIDARRRAIEKGDNYLISNDDALEIVNKYKITEDELHDFIKQILVNKHE